MMNSSRIIHSLKSNNKFLLQICKTTKLNRTFLSESYSCQDAWNQRLKSPLLSKIKPIDFFLDLDQKFQSGNRVNAVDIDIFANIIQDESHADEIADLLYKIRNTRETTFTLQSTHYAVVRYYISIGEAEQLLSILNDRLNYGIFCDYFCYNLLMDHFIKKENFVAAAKVATYMMLQEEFEHPISNSMALYSCHKYLENPDAWQEEDPEEIRKREEPKEEVKVRVRYLVNPYFDDHFDLWKPSDLVGKTLYWIGQTMDNPLGRSCHLRGLLLYRKFDEATSLMKKWNKEGIKEIVYKNLFSLIKTDIPEIFGEETDEKTKELKQLLGNLESGDLCQANLEEDLKNLVKKAVEEHSREDITKQTKLFDEWEEKRMQILQEQIDFLNKQQRLAEVEEMKKDLIERERVLTFFENEEEIELKIQEKLEKEAQLYGDDKVVEEDLNENYVPPEIVKKRH